MVWQSSTNEDTAFPWWYDEGTPLSRTCFIFGHGMCPTQEPPCRFQNSSFQFSRFARFSQSVNLFHLALDMAMVPFQFFSCLFTDPFLSGVIGVFLLVRCIPHQNSQRLFWASVCVRWSHHLTGENYHLKNVRLDEGQNGLSVKRSGYISKKGLWFEKNGVSVKFFGFRLGAHLKGEIRACSTNGNEGC